MELNIKLGLGSENAAMLLFNSDDMQLILKEDKFYLSEKAMSYLKLNNGNKNKIWLFIGERSPYKFYIVNATNMNVPETEKMHVNKDGRFSNLPVYSKMVLFNNTIELKPVSLEFAYEKVEALQLLISKDL